MSDESSIPVKRLSAGRVQCTVTFTPEQVAPAEQQALRQLGGSVNIDGFRPGHAPVEEVRKRVEPQKVFEETIRLLVPETFKKAVSEHDLKPIIAPNVEAKSHDPLTLVITFVEFPQVTVKNAKKISVKKTEVKADEKDVQRVIDQMLQQHQKTKEADRAAKEGDRVTMDFWGEKDSKEIENTRATDHPVVIGSHSLIPGFEEELVGLEKGASKDFTVTFPKDYHATELAGQPVIFHVTVKKVEEVENPELTDAFVKEHLHADSKEDLKKKIMDSMIQQEEQIDRQRREQELFDQIRKATSVELAPELIADEQRGMIDELAQKLAQNNLTIEDWLKDTGKKVEEFTKEIEEQAQQKLQLRLGIQKLVEEEAIELSDDDVQAEIKTLLAPLPDEERLKVLPMYEKGKQAWEQLKWQKRVERLMEKMLG